MHSAEPAEAIGPVMRSLALPVYIPWLASGIGTGVLLPVLPLYLLDHGLSFSAVSVVLAAAGFGSVLGGIPAGAISHRRGEDLLLAMALVAMGFTAALLGLTTAVTMLVALRITYGFGTVGVGQSRQTFITRRIDPRHRGRVMSLVGGSFRLAVLVGPLIGGVTVELAGFRAAFVLSGILSASGLLALFAHRRTAGPESDTTESHIPMRTGIRRHFRRLVVTGFGPMLVMAARSGRHVVVPLIGNSLGLSPAAVGALVAVGTAADFLLFPVAGYVMDRFGRLRAIVPAFTLMAAGLLLLGTAHTATAAIVAGVVMGVGNGLSAGSLLTLGSDLAPDDATAPFIAGFNLMADLGRVIGPLIVGWSADAIGLGRSAVVLAGVLMAGLVWLVVTVGETNSETRVNRSRAPQG